MNSSLDALSMYQSSMSVTATQTKAKNLQNSLENLDNSTDEELMDVCKSFEAYFLEQVFKSMQKTIMKDEGNSTESGYTSYFQDMLMQEYANNATETGGYGIAQMLYESMKRQ